MAPSGTISLKLMVDTKCQRVLFAEAGKDFVDFLFSILSFPGCTVAGLISKQDMAGCLGNIYDSLQNLSETYMLPDANKDNVLKPVTMSNYTSTVTSLLPNLPSSILSCINLYRCEYANSKSNCTTFANDPNTRCPFCNYSMSAKVTFVPSKPSTSSLDEGGYVKGFVTYMIMDDLVVSPMSTISCITVLKKFNVKDARVLEERLIDIGTNEAVQLLKACEESKTVLTDVFIGKKVEQSKVTDSPGMRIAF